MPYMAPPAPPAEAAVNVVDFGADPTTHNDSSPAFDRALAHAINSRNASRSMARHILDLGGVTLSLQGGDYLLTRPLSIPTGIGNLKVTGGTLRAASSFPHRRFLIEVGAEHSACVAADPKQSRVTRTSAWKT